MHLFTKCGSRITISERAQEHLLAHPDIWRFLPEATNKIVLPSNRSVLAIEVELGRVIGRSGCVSTPVIGIDDKAAFAVRLARLAPSRVAVGAIGLEVRHLVVKARPTDQPGVYSLVTAYVGDLAPREPHDPTLTPEEQRASLEFWMTHALVYDPAIMGPVIETCWSEVLRQARLM